MRAIVQHRYGPPHEVLQLENIERPLPDEGQVLIRVRAASLHADVWHAVTGRPHILRLMGSGVRRPRQRVPGTDLAGVVEEVGEGATRFEPGDEVFGQTVGWNLWMNGGTFAEYACASETALAPKPSGLTFAQAAAVPTSGIIAIRHVRTEARVEAGQRVLINGAGGAVGTFCVQLAKAYGAAVTDVDTSDKLAMLKSIGADEVIDFTQEDFTRTGVRYDAIVDIPGNRSFKDLRRALAAGGRYVLIAHDDYGRHGGRWLGSGIPRILALAIRAPFGRRSKDENPLVESGDPLTTLVQLIDDGKITPVIDREFPLSDVVEALDYQATGRPQGKVTITIS